MALQPLTTRQKSEFFHQLATLLEAGLSLHQSIGLAAPAGSSQFQREMQTVSQAIARGDNLNVTLSRYPKYFDPWILSLLRLTEYSGAIPTGCRQISQYLEQQQYRHKLYRSAIISLALCLLSLLLLGKVVLQGSMLFWVLLFPLLAVLGLLVQGLTAKKPNPGLYQGLSQVPLLGDLLRVRSLLHFTELALPLSCGVPILTAVELVRDRIPDPKLAAHLNRAIRQLRTGTSLTDSLQGSLPPIAQQMIQVGETTGNLDGMLRKLTEHYEGELKKILSRLDAVLRVLSLLSFGSLVLILGIQMIQTQLNRLPG